MSTFTTVELQCPACAQVFQSYRAPHHVHSCIGCGYAAVEDRFTSDWTVTPEVMANILTELAPRAQEVTASLMCETAAKIAKWEGAGPLEIADLLLRAAACSAEEDDAEAERFFNRKAAWKLEEALETYQEVPESERPGVTQTVAELWARVGDEKKALDWLEPTP